MAETFSLEEAYGTSPRGDFGAQAAADAARRHSDQIRIRERELADPSISHEDKIAIGEELRKIRATGQVPEPKPQSISLEEAYGPRSETDIRVGGAKAATRALAREVADFGDLLLSIPGMAIGTAGDVASRIESLARGENPAAASRIAQGVRRGLTEKLSPQLPSGEPLLRGLVEKAIQAVSPDDQEVNSTSVQKGMELLTQGIEKGGGWVEKKTGGLINSADFDSVVNEVMALGGLKGAYSGARGFTPEGKAAAAERARRDVQRRLPQEPPAPRQEPGPLPEEPPARGETQAEVPPVEAPPSPALASGTAKIREGRSFDLTSEERIATREAGVVPDPTLISALVKSREGRGFDLTAQEKVALRGWAETKPAEGGRAGQTLLNIMAVGGIGAALAWAYPQEARDAALATFAGGALLTGDVRRIAAHPDTAPLGVILRDSGTTLKTLERLPQNRTEFPRQMIEEQLRRPDVTKAEKDALNSLLEKVPAGGKISAKDLVMGFKLETGDFELRAKETGTYANYGLENVGRIADDEFGGRFIPEGQDVAEQPIPARTTLYRLPDDVKVSSDNHFNDPNLYGWTRSFDEGGVRHVVEIQSDLAQHAKALTPERRAQLQAELDSLLPRLERQKSWSIFQPETTVKGTLEAINRDLAGLDAAELKALDDRLAFRRLAGFNPRDGAALEAYRRHLTSEDLANARTARGDVMAALGEVYRAGQVKRAELEAALAAGQGVSRIEPMLKGWTKRLIREELAAGATRGELSVRFATADTVAKVEGWPEIARMQRENANYYRRGTPEYEAAIKEAETSEATGNRFSPQHQSIYNRYKGDIEKFLTQLGGKPFTDPAGHTWIEVPTDPGVGAAARRVQMFGGATEKALATLAGISIASLAGSYFASDKPKGALIGGALGLGGALLVSKSPAVRGAAAQTLNVADKTLGLISTRVMNLDPRLARAWSDLEYHTIAKAYESLDAVHPFISAMNKLPRAERSRARALWQASDVAGWQAFLQAHPDVAKEWPRTANVIQLQNLELASRGMHSAYQHGAFPHFGTDPKASPAETLTTFIRAATAEVEKANFFGPSAVVNRKGTQLNARKSIAKFADDAKTTYGLSDAQATELGDMLRARFGPGETGGNKALQDVKNATYTALLANPVSATVQLTDIPIQVALRGLGPTLEGVARSVTGKKNFSIREMGLLNHIAEEYAGERLSSRVMKKTFQLGLFTAMDTFSKDVVVNSAFAELRNLAKKDPTKFVNRFEPSLGIGDAGQLLQDLRNGTKSDLVNATIFAELSRSQPVSRFELPEAYLNHPNGRVLFMLKTYALKQADLMRREAYNKIKVGETREGLGNLAKLGAAFMVAGASQDWIRDWMLGRGFDPKVTDLPAGLLQTMGLSPYLGDKIKKGELKEAVVGATLPPVSMLDDVVNGREKSVQYIPLVGKLYYSHGMGGAEKWKAWQRKQEIKEQREKLLSPEEREEKKRRREERRRQLDKLRAAEYDRSR